MIRDIEIQNFRCFDHTKIEGFDRVNLIGGKNNSGKTALLEALIVAHAPDDILELKYLRKESTETIQSLPEQTLENLYFERKSSQKIELKTQSDAGVNINTSVSFYQDFSSIPKDSLSNLEKSESIGRVLRNFFERGSDTPPILEINRFSENEKIDSKDLLETSSHHLLFVDTEVCIKAFVNSELFSLRETPPENLDLLPVIPVFTNRSRAEIAQDYERLILQEEEKQQYEVLKAFQILDPSIEKIESFSIGSPNLYLTKKGGKRLPIALFGDAINRLARIVLKLLNNNSSILLIDEIENGIHYTNQREFWKILFRLAIELDTQIFATTHSLEMIRAFADVGLEYYPDRGAYFELLRSPRTDKILGIKRDLDTLHYALEHDNQVRGER